MEVPTPSGHWSWIITVIIASVFMTMLFVMGWIISDIPQERYLTSGILIAAGACGWVVGMLLSPDSRAEAKNFSMLGKSVSLFISGYLVSKVDGIVTSIFEPAALLHSVDNLERLTK